MERPSDDVASAVVEEASALVADADVALASPALGLASSVLRRASDFPKACEKAKALVVPAALSLASSPLMQKPALVALRGFFAALTRANLAGADFETTLASLMDRSSLGGHLLADGGGGSSSAAMSAAGTSSGSGVAEIGKAVAKCVAATCAAAGADASRRTTSKLIASLEKSGSLKAGKGGKAPKTDADASERLLALLCLGELGRAAAATDAASEEDALERVLLAALDASGEDLKSAASFALGGVAAGNRARFLPTILAKMDEMPTHRYSLLCSLGEVIRAGEPEDDDDDDGGGDGDASSAAKTAQLSDAELDQILDVLFKNAGSDEEGVRNVTAECLGRLAARRPTRLLPELTSRLDPALHPDASTRVTAVTAVKHLARAVAKRKDAVLSALVAPCLASCVVGPNAALSDEDVGVRRVLSHTGSHTTAFAWWTPILKDFFRRVACLSAHPSLLSIPALGAFQR